MNCEKCNREIPEDSKFCVHCGQKVSSEKLETKEEKKVNQELPLIISDISNHLEFMGFELEDNQFEDNGIIRFLATHKIRPNFFISYFPFANALLFVANYRIPKVETESKKHKLLEVSNIINSNVAIISTFYVGKDFDGIAISTWYPDTYSKKEFSNFLEYFQSEISKITVNEDLKEFI